MNVPTCLRCAKGNRDKGSVKIWSTIWVLPEPSEVGAAVETGREDIRSEAGSQASGGPSGTLPDTSVVTPQEGLCSFANMTGEYFEMLICRPFSSYFPLSPPSF